MPVSQVATLFIILFHEPRPLLDCEIAMDSKLPRYGQYPRLCGIHTSVAGRACHIVTNVSLVLVACLYLWLAEMTCVTI